MLARTTQKNCGKLPFSFLSCYTLPRSAILIRYYRVANIPANVGFSFILHLSFFSFCYFPHSLSLASFSGRCIFARELRADNDETLIFTELVVTFSRIFVSLLCPYLFAENYSFREILQTVLVTTFKRRGDIIQ